MLSFSNINWISCSRPSLSGSGNGGFISFSLPSSFSVSPSSSSSSFQSGSSRSPEAQQISSPDAARSGLLRTSLLESLLLARNRALDLFFSCCDFRSLSQRCCSCSCRFRCCSCHCFVCWCCRSGYHLCSWYCCCHSWCLLLHCCFRSCYFRCSSSNGCCSSTAGTGSGCDCTCCCIGPSFLLPALFSSPCLFPPPLIGWRFAPLFGGSGGYSGSMVALASLAALAPLAALVAAAPACWGSAKEAEFLLSSLFLKYQSGPCPPGHRILV